MEEGFEPVPIDRMGGLVTLLDPADVPPGCSPDCRDNGFYRGNVRSRQGSETIQELTAGKNVNYLKTYINPDLQARLLMYDSGGSLWQETAEGEPGTHSLISSTYQQDQILQSVTAFGREWIAASTGIKGLDLPTVWDGTNLYLVGNQPPAVGSFAAVDGAAGSIVAGVHQVVVFFESESGALSAPSTPISWTAAGGAKVNLTGIPVWPAVTGERPVIARRVAFTAAGGATFFYIPDGSMRIADNVTTTLTVDFTEAQLLAGEDISKLFRGVVPTASTDFQGQLGVGSYGRRLVWWGGNPNFGEPFRSTLVRWSDPDDPEFYDSLLGIMQVREDDGQGVRAGYELDDRFFFAKEHSLYSVRDDGANPPSSWDVVQESPTIGSVSVNGVGKGEDWVALFGRAGLFYHRSGQPIKISQEIQPTWNAINWTYGHKGWVKVDIERKRLFVGAPFCTGQVPNLILMCDYEEGILVDPISNQGQGRKWSPWFLSAGSSDIAQRDNKQARVVMGLTDGSGKVRELRDSKTEDETTAINSYYRTAYVGRPELGRSTFGFLTANARGAGPLMISTFRQGAIQTTWNSVNLANPPLRDLEKMIDVQTERCSFRFGTFAVGAWYSLVKFCAWTKEHAWAKFRGATN